MAKSAWWDIDKRGRRLEAISRQMNTMFWNNLEDNTELAISYLDKMVIIEKTIQPYVEQVTGIKRFLKKHDQGVPVYLPE